MLHPHQLLDRHGLLGAREWATHKHDRMAIDTAALFRERGVGAGIVRASLLTAGLPHKAPRPATHWERPLINGSGFRLSSALDESGAPGCVPYGSKARMILFYLQDQYLQTTLSSIPVGTSMHSWVKRLGRPGSGGMTYRIIAEQSQRLDRCTFGYDGHPTCLSGPIMTLHLNGPASDADRPSSDAGIAGEDDGNMVQLGDAFAKATAETRIDVNRLALYCLANNSAAMDVYLSLGWLLPRLAAPRLLAWSELAAIFGTGFRNPVRSRTPFMRALQMVLAVYPEATVAESSDGVLVEPSAPPHLTA